MSTPFYKEQLDLNNIRLDLSDRHQKTSNPELIKRIAVFFKKMLEDQKKVDAVWKPAGEWKNYNEEKGFLYTALANNEFEKANEFLGNFWRNKLGLIVKEYATFETLLEGSVEKVKPFLSSILRNYLIWKDIYGIHTKSLEVIAEVGNPWGCVIDKVLVTPKATRYHHNAMQIKNLLSTCDGKVVGEIGAGYGALCHYIQKESTPITYIDFDLPETLVLAAYHLISAFPDKSVFLYGEGQISDEIIKKYDIVLVPNYTISLFSNKCIDVFFNSFSLSEMMPDANARYIQEISRTTKGYFLHNNMDRSGVINRGFERIPASKYPIQDSDYILLSKNYDLFHAHNGDYKEFLYKVVSK